jgi:ferrous iron transport protein A
MSIQQAFPPDTKQSFQARALTLTLFYNKNKSHLHLACMRLSDLPKGASSIVRDVRDAYQSDAIAQRLRDLGFVPGEPVRVVASGPWGADPLLIQIGSTRFALRRAEADRVMVESVDDAVKEAA